MQPLSRSATRFSLAITLGLGALSAQPKLHPDEMAMKPKIDGAIAKGIDNILNQQRRDGSWSANNYPGGRTALCAYALLKSGVRLDHPGLRRAFAFLDTVDPQKTYSTACMMLAYSATGDEQYKPRLRRLAAKLIEWQARQGSWGYPHGHVDLSNTQYAALGLWTANKAGVRIPAEAWNNLIQGALRYQEAPHYVDIKVGKNTGVSKLQVAGFEYRPSQRKGPRRATGTMTTAGVSILKICEIGLGKKLRKKARRQLNYAIDLGLNWLHAHFSVKHPQLPGKGGNWLHYYLYGMERVGSLTRKEQFGGHWWYVEGARALLKQQNKQGAWGRAIHDTCFALLFLRRATRVGATTGGVGGKSSHLFAAGDKNDDIHFRGAGQLPVMLYINKFGRMLLEEHADYGLRILRVEYMEGKRKLGELAGDPTKVWKSDTFLYRCSGLSHGEHTIVARVIAIDPAVPPGETTRTVTIESKPMKVVIRDIVEPWMEAIAQMQRDNLLRTNKPKLTVSSQEKTAKNLIDGLDATHWFAAKDDATPTITFEFAKPVAVRRILLSQAFQSRADLDRIGFIRTVEVLTNRSKKPQRISMHANPLAPTEFELKKTIKVRKLVLRVVGRMGKPGLPIGFAEIVLAAKKRKKR